MITQLTPEQESRFPEFVKKWTDIGLSTQPADRPRAERAIKGLYALVKLKEPRIIWLPCPISAALSAMIYTRYVNGESAVNSAVYSAVYSAVNSAVNSAVYSAVYSAVNSAVESAVNSAVYSAVNSAVESAVESAVNSAVWSAVNSAVESAVESAVKSAGMAYTGGSLWAGYSAWADYFSEVVGIQINRDYLEVTESCGYYWTLDGVCFASERPTIISLDNDSKLHSNGYQSIGYPSGWGLFHKHGEDITETVYEWAKQHGYNYPWGDAEAVHWKMYFG